MNSNRISSFICSAFLMLSALAVLALLQVNDVVVLSAAEADQIKGGAGQWCSWCDRTTAQLCAKCQPPGASNCEYIGVDKYGVTWNKCLRNLLDKKLAGSPGCEKADTMWGCRPGQRLQYCKYGTAQTSPTNCGKYVVPRCKTNPADKDHPTKWCEPICDVTTSVCIGCVNN